MYALLIERVRANLHIVLGMSPVGEPFIYTYHHLVHMMNVVQHQVTVDPQSWTVSLLSSTPTITV